MLHKFLRLFILLSLIATIVTIYSLTTHRATDAAVEFTDLTAIQIDNQLHVTIPYESAVPAQSSTLAVEIIDAEDRVVARQLLSDNARSAHAWRAKLIMPAEVKREDLVWYRLRYRFISQNSNNSANATIHPIGELLRYPVLRVLGQQDFAAGAPNSLRIIAVDGRSGDPITGNLQIDLQIPGRNSQSLRTQLDERGTVEPRLQAPNDFAGQAELKLKLSTPLGTQQLVQPVNIVRRENILLTTDKPIYQPGHLIYIRSLALDRFSRRAVANQPLTFEIEDAKGNKVFKSRTTTDEFGVASTQFQLAEEVNMGTFKLRAILGEAGSSQANVQEKSFTVDRYVLPKFKIDIKLKGGEDERQQKKYYSPGETVSGQISAKYLFGKPISKGHVNIKLMTFDVETVEIGKAEAFTDDTGQYNFALKLPTAFAGRSFEQGAAPIALQVEVTDSANHSETRAENLLVASNPILITAIPESGEVVSRLSNKVYLLTAYPDGTPARTRISGNIQPALLTTDKDGIVTIELDGTATSSLQLRAEDEQGRIGIANVALKKRAAGDESLILRTDRALYRVGESMEITAISTKTKGAIYIDVIKDRQTILTKALDLEKGRAKMALDLSPDLFGTIEVRAYVFGRNADPISDRRIVFIDPADDLQVEAAVTHESYRPGEEAQVNLSVKDKFGQPKQAVLDVQVVDEAVFALSEKQPGFEKVFFYLEQELLKPRYEIHSVGAADILPVVQEDQEAQQHRQRAAQVLLAAASEVNAYTLRGNYGQDSLKTKENEYYQKYTQLSSTKLERAVKGLNQYYTNSRAEFSDLNRDLIKAVEAGYVTHSDSVDPWGHQIKFEGQVNGDQAYYTAIIDIPGDANQKIYHQISGTKTRLPATQQTQKPFNGKVIINNGVGANTNYARIAGHVSKTNNQPLANAIVKVRSKSSKKGFTVRTNQQGVFQFDALAAGSYEITIEASGYYTTTHRWIELTPRDQAFVEVALEESHAGAIMKLEFYSYEKQMRVRRRAEFNLGDVAKAEMAPVMAQAAPKPSLDAPRNKRADKEGRDLSVQEEEKSTTGASGQDDQGSEGTRVRSYFPETLYVNPKIVTDQQGRALLRIPLADSITTWRLSMFASTKAGALGSATAGIRVFQDFFIDLDLPVSLTQDDTATIPVAIYNYLSDAQEVELSLQSDEWFSLVDDQPIKRINIAAGEVSAISYRIRAARIGTHKLTVSARLTSRNSAANGDAIARQIEVLPNGEQQNITVNDRLESSASKELTIPADAITDASKILVKFYPGPLSQVVEGLDSILRMPNGCFEQSSSATYPNILVLDYMKTTKRITPEIQAKAEGFISLGYQRLVTFEVPGGGFSWFGQAPANKILTAYGLMEFFDMSKVHEVDPRLIQRTQTWLAQQQQADGSWQPDTQFIDEGTTNNFHNDRVRIAAYLGWALAYSGYRGEAIERAKQFIQQQVNGQEDAYTLAILANFAADYQQDPAWTERVMGTLINKATERDKTAFWSISNQTPTHAYGDMAEIETTALAAQALIKWGRASTMASKALQYLTEKKDAYGNWQSTQATILALKAFLLSQQKGSAGDTEGTISVIINGQQVRELNITRDNNDLLHQLDLKQYTQVGRNQVELRMRGKGSLLYQIVARYYRPWGQTVQQQRVEPLGIELKYDRTRLAQDDIATATVTIRNNLTKSAKMIMVDLGIPPGFEVQSEDFQQLIGRGEGKAGHLTKFSVTAKQVILYFDGLQARQVLTLKYRLRAKYPIKAKTFASRVYEYYNPAVGATAQPIDIAVVEKGKK
ncbi:MAG: MG2 domain-containing protein [Acidobacteriota bacterium]